MIQIFTFVKDEIEIMDDWLLYHSWLVGTNNIYVVDNGSTDGTRELLAQWEKKGIKVTTALVHMTEKGATLSEWMKLEGREWLLPLDADEFILSLDGIHSLPPGGYRYKFDQLNPLVQQKEYDDPLIDMTTFGFDPASENKYAKSFFHAHWFESTDMGNHLGEVKDYKGDIATNLVLIHFAIRGYQHFVRKTLQAAEHFSHDQSREIVYKLGWHHHERYWAIQDGKGLELMFEQHGAEHPIVDETFANRLLRLRNKACSSGQLLLPF